MPRGILGVANLRERLSKVLLDHIKSELPALIDEIQDIVHDTEQALAKLGERRSDVEQQRMYLLKHSQAFTSICKASCDGIYENTFFGELSDKESRSHRFRAVVQNLNVAFAENIRTRGHHMDLLGDGPEGKSEKALAWARETLVNSRGRELPGTFSPMLIGDLFRVQSRPWEYISSSHVKDVWNRARKHAGDILPTLMDPETREALLVWRVDPLIEQLFETANNKLESLFCDRHKHAITYNHYFSDNVQKSFNTRNEKRLLGVLETMFPELYSNERVGPADLSQVCTMVSKTIPDMDTYASIDLLDHVEAFYKVAMKTFTDNVAIQVIEASIVNSLPGVFTPFNVAQMTNDLVRKIAAEPQENLTQRELFERKLDVLKQGMKTCKRYATRHISDTTPPSPVGTETISSPPSLEEHLDEAINEVILEQSADIIVEPRAIQEEELTLPTISKKSKKKGKHARYSDLVSL